jgi:DNA polymerase-3 subunit alpha
MIKWHIENELTRHILSDCKRLQGLSLEEHKRLYVEVKNIILQNRHLDFLKRSVDPAWIKVDNKVNSLLLYVLELTDDKPTGAQRIASKGSYADFDIDFSQEKRDQVFAYLKEKYGEDHTANVCTFSKLAARAAIRSAQRALGYAIEKGDIIAREIPNVPDIKLQDVINDNEVLQSFLQNKNNEFAIEKNILEIALQLEGLPQALSVHACAFIVSDKPVTSYMPEMIATKKDGSQIITQFEYYDVEAIGCLKFDFLGLKTLDVIANTVKLVEERHGVKIDIDNIDVNDPGIYKIINEGHNCGIFQFESNTAASFVSKVKPANINELSDLTSLMRPGPLSMGMMDSYAKAKFNNEKYTYGLKDQKLIEKVWEICSSSYGLMVYQEQCIRCFTDIGGFNEIEGDNARRAMGKKKPEEMASLHESFVSGGVKLGYKKDDLGELFKQIEGFSGYGFNLSHAICYSFLSAQTGYLSNYYPLEFYATLLTIDSGKTADVRRYVGAVKKRGFKVLSPSINRSEVDFLIDDNSIIFGLSGVKGVGKGVSTKILKRRPKKNYKSFGHFILKNVDILNKKILDQYAKAGVFRDFGINKVSALQSVQEILKFMDIQKSISERHTIFDLCKIDLQGFIDETIVKKIAKEDPLGYEIETLGLYITRHPLEDYVVVNRGDFVQVEDLYRQMSDSIYVTVGAICNIDIRKTKKKKNMASFDITGPTDDVQCICFPQKYDEVKDLLEEGALVSVTGLLRDEDEGKIFIVNKISKDYRQHLGTFIPKTSSFTPSNNEIKEVVINDNLKYVLWR